MQTIKTNNIITMLILIPFMFLIRFVVIKKGLKIPKA